jgi:hypothetical protein
MSTGEPDRRSQEGQLTINAPPRPIQATRPSTRHGDGVCAGTGNDTVTLQDGTADKADGGPGTDTVTSHDAADVLTNFEVIH